MAAFEMIKYHGLHYPTDIPLRIEEISAHFDVLNVNGDLGKSLHTEYSYGKRKWDTTLVKQYSEIIAAQKDKVPQLWKNETWALQFAQFISKLIVNDNAPQIIEIHPPFSDYSDIPGLVRNYSAFENKITGYFPDVQILIENRCGSIYHGGKFILSKNKDISLLCNEIARANLRLRIAYDIPQIYTAHNAKTEKEYINLLEEAKTFREYIGGVHLWGKSISSTGRKVAHCGDLNSYFGNAEIKKHFLSAFKDCFDDGITRKMVLEVNSGNKDMQSIITDLRSVGISFV